MFLKIIIVCFLVSQILFAQGNGILQFEILDSRTNERIPGKIVLLQDGNIPNLKAPSGGMLASRENTIYTGDGAGIVSIPAGKYEIWAGRGMEYSVDVQSIEILPNKEAKLITKIRREIKTPGYVSGDLHLHTLTFSGHGDSNVEERIISCVAEGLEWAVATDHNHHTDYDTVQQSLKLMSEMKSTVGNEVSTPSIGHLNVFPLEKGSPVLPYKSKDAGELFRQIREVAGEVVIQLNHPRWPGAAFFTEMRLDESLAESPLKTWSWDFDAFEILNDNRGLGWIAEPGNPISVKQDWFNMLNNGRRQTGIGNSDSHSVLKAIAAVPRNYIASSTDDPAKISEKELAANIKKQNVSVSSGIYIELEASSQPIGSTVAAKDGKVSLDIRVQAASWISCDTLKIIENGKVLQTHILPQTESPIRFEKAVTLNPKRDSWYVLIANGAKSMAPMVHDAGDVPIMPLAFTNPIWVDADGDNHFTSLREYAADILQTHKNEPEKLAEIAAASPELMTPLIGVMQKVGEKERIVFLKQLLPIGNQEARLLIYRQLGKIKNVTAGEVLIDAAKKCDLPLEQFTIAANLEKIPGGARLFEELSAKALADLGKTFRIFHREGNLRHWQIATTKAGEIPDSNAWQNFTVPKNGIIDLRKVIAEGENTTSWAAATFYARSSGEMQFVYRNPQKATLFLNGKEYPMPVAKIFTVISLPLRKLKNTLKLKLDNSGQSCQFVMEALDPDDQLDENMAYKTVYRHLAFEQPVTLETANSPKYSGGETALTDGLRGSENFLDGYWQGFEHADMAAVIDLKESKAIHKITAGFLHNDGSWIYLPLAVEFAISEDGKRFDFVKKIDIEMPSASQKTRIENFSAGIDGQTARYVRVIARNIRVNPDWHSAPGGHTWIFADEILVE